MGQRHLLIGGVIGAFVLGGGMYASPYITLYQMYQAVEHQDVQGIASHVDFPALRESVKTNLKTIVSKEAAQQNPLLGLLGAVLGGVILDPVIETVVTPEGVAALLEGQRLQLGDLRGQQPQFSDKAAAVDVKANYESLNQFAVSVKPKGEETTPVTLLMSRDGLAWKISGVRLPGGS